MLSAYLVLMCWLLQTPWSYDAPLVQVTWTSTHQQRLHLLTHLLAPQWLSLLLLSHLLPAQQLLRRVLLRHPPVLQQLHLQLPGHLSTSRQLLLQPGMG